MLGLLGSVGSFLGGIFGNKAADKRQAEMLAWQERMDNTKIQRTQADAKAAGVHPIAAMGGSLHSPSPVSVGGHTDFSNMGQNIGRAVEATMDSHQKQSEVEKMADVLKLENMELQNDVIRTQLANSAAATVRQAGNPPVYSALGDLVDGASYAAGNKASRSEILEHNRWQGARHRRQPGITGEDMEKEYNDLANVGAFSRAMTMLQRNPHVVIEWLRDVNGANVTQEALESIHGSLRQRRRNYRQKGGAW